MHAVKCLFMNVLLANRIAPDGTPHSGAALFCLCSTKRKLGLVTRGVLLKTKPCINVAILINTHLLFMLTTGRYMHCNKIYVGPKRSVFKTSLAMISSCAILSTWSFKKLYLLHVYVNVHNYYF